jgi:hypothetical protein
VRQFEHSARTTIDVCEDQLMINMHLPSSSPLALLDLSGEQGAVGYMSRQNSVPRSTDTLQVRSWRTYIVSSVQLDEKLPAHDEICRSGISPLDLDKAFCAYWLVAAPRSVNEWRVVSACDSHQSIIQAIASGDQTDKKQIGHSEAFLYMAASSSLS